MLALDRPNHTGVPAVRVRFQKGRAIHGTVLTDLNPGDVIEVTYGSRTMRFRVLSLNENAKKADASEMYELLGE